MILKLFIQYATDLLGDTNTGLTGSEIVKYCVAYASDFNVEIPYISSPLPMNDPKVPNKRTALKLNLEKFTPEQQFKIIKELCELDQFKDNSKIKNLKIKLVNQYGHLNRELDSINKTLINETQHWLNDYPNSLKQYKSALDKFKGNIFERNLLDDLRLSLELLLKQIFNNEKSLENQLSDLGNFIESKKGSKELGNMFQKLVEYFAKYQNSHVKHNDKVIKQEVDLILELTSSFMKHLIQINSIEL